jgi:dipeptidase E
MSQKPPQVVAFGGGGFSMEPGNTLLDDYVLSLAEKERPKVCFLPSASGDADHYVVRFYRFFGDRSEASHISLFRRDHGPANFREHLLDQDIIYVGGGCVLSLLGVWGAHGIDSILRECWERGVILCGVSAGSLCWFREGVTAFHGEAQPYKGLGILPWSNTVHYDAERGRGDEFRRQLVEGMTPGFAAEDGAALHFQGEKLHRVVTSRPDARAFRMRCTNGRVARKPLRSSYLGGDHVPVPEREPSIVLAPEPTPAAAPTAAAG